MLQFWLSYNNGAERLRLPVNPEAVSVRTSRGYKDVNVTQLGEITVIGESKLKDFSFKSFFPRDYDEAYCEYVDIPDPWDAVKTIERWRDTGRPIRLTITGTPINYPVTIRYFDYEEKAGHVGDQFFSISLKEYKFVSFEKIQVVDEEVQVSSSPRPSTKTPPETYIVKSGDTLWEIAHRELGRGSRWREIYNKNKDVIGPNPNLIKVGQKFVMPS